MVGRFRKIALHDHDGVPSRVSRHAVRRPQQSLDGATVADGGFLGKDRQRQHFPVLLQQGARVVARAVVEDEGVEVAPEILHDLADLPE